MPDRSWALQRKLMRAPNIGFNAEVYRWFKDLDDVPSVSRTALRDSLLIQPKESRTSALFKVQYFRDFVQKVHNRVNIIGVPKEKFDVTIELKYKPIVQLYFQQDKAAVSPDYAPITAEISFRLMDESTETITQANITALANKIRTEFATGAGYTFNKGKYIATYYDKPQGYYLRIYVLNDAEGVEVVRKVLSIRNHTYNEEFFRITEPKKNSVNTTSNQTILGKIYKEPRWRPTATVRFQWASLILHTVPDPIFLVDRTFSRYRPVISI
jgi:hypothetical protein